MLRLSRTFSRLRTPHTTTFHKRTFTLTIPRKMPSYDDVDVITAYTDNLPNKAFEQPGAGQEHRMGPQAEHSKLEHWDAEGKPFLKEYQGNGKLKGKVALVTGADSGIGRSVAIMFAREGAALSIVYLPEEKKDAEDVRDFIQKSPLSPNAKVNLIAADLSKHGDDEAKRIISDHVEKLGSLDILVNNAGQQITCKDITKIDMDDVRSTFQINIVAMFALVKHAMPYLKRGSAIVNSTSVTAYQGSAGFTDYASTKGAIVSFTRSMATQLAPKGIRVNAVAPGPVYTPLQPAARPASEMEGFGAGKVPLHQRAGQPAELGPSYVFLASADANFITGQVVHVNAGQLTAS